MPGTVPDSGLSGPYAYVEDVRDETAFRATTKGESETLAAFLRFHQDTLPMKLDGLTEEPLRRSMVESGLSLIGLLKHATYVHVRWFELCFRNDTPTDLRWPTDDWTADADQTSASLIDDYRRHVDIARVIVDESHLDELNAGWSGGNWEPGTYNLRWIVVHMIEELARHNGHADIIREQLDGTTGV